jgi:phytoene dehydrogenase-like protein
VHLGVDFVPDMRPATHISSPMPVGIAMMSKLDPSAAPAGHATLMLISLLPFEEAKQWFPADGNPNWSQWRRSEEYEERKTVLGDRMIAAVENIVPDLSKHIVYRCDASPVTYARYDWSTAGAIYGVSNSGRIKGSKSPVPGLVIAGSGNAGAGVEAALISGAQAAETLVAGLLADVPCLDNTTAVEAQSTTVTASASIGSSPGG